MGPNSANLVEFFASESVSFELAPGVSLSQAQAAINRAVSVLTLPTSIQGRFTSRWRDGQDFRPSNCWIAGIP